MKDFVQSCSQFSAILDLSWTKGVEGDGFEAGKDTEANMWYGP